ncbi:unnamed protein product [Camellia sinensis]
MTRRQTHQNFNKQEREVRRERCPAQTSVTCDGSRRTPSFFALHACELELTREAPAAALDRSRSHRRRSRSFLQALVRRAPLRSPLCRRLAFHALCSSLRRSLRSLRHRRPRPRVAPGMHMLPKLLLYRFTFSSQCPGRRPTYEFPHPLARVPQSTGYWLSYIVVDLLIWWGIRGYINDFRKRNLKLAPIAYFSLYRGSVSHLPTAYMWSPHVMPKPSVLGPPSRCCWLLFPKPWVKVSTSGQSINLLRSLFTGFKKDLNLFILGLGAWPLEDPKKTMDIILEALKNTGQRGIICRGWGDLVPEVSDSVFPLEDCPHDWLFPQCLAVLYMPGNTTQMHSFVMHFKVTDLCDRSLKGNDIVTNVQVHHGSAGTTATGLRAGGRLFFFFFGICMWREWRRVPSVRAWFHCHRRRACHGCRPIISGLHLHNCNDCPEARCMVFATRNSFRLVAPG